MVLSVGEEQIILKKVILIVIFILLFKSIKHSMKNKTFYLLIIVSFTLLFCKENKVEMLPPGKAQKFTFQYTNEKGRIERPEYILSVPFSYNIEKQYPLFVTLTGGNYTAEEFHKLWQPFADSLGVILVTPARDNKDSTKLAWNENSDFMVLSCMDRVAEKVNLNLDKIYVGGFFEGGTLAYKLGFKYPQIFKGIAAISAKLPEYYKTENLEFLKSTKFFITAGELETEIKPDADRALELMIKNGILTQHIIYFNIKKGFPEPMQPELKKIVKYFFDEKEK